MRNIINKGITEEDIYKAVTLAAASGMKNVKLYYMIGLPQEEDADIDEMTEWCAASVKKWMKQATKAI